MNHDEMEILYLLELEDTPLEEVKDRDFIPKWLAKHDLPATMNNLFFLGGVHLRWAMTNMKEMFKL